MGQASEPARFPGPLFLVSLGLVAARSLGNYTESRHIKREMKAPHVLSWEAQMAARTVFDSERFQETGLKQTGIDPHQGSTAWVTRPSNYANRRQASALKFLVLTFPNRSATSNSRRYMMR